MRKRQQGSIQCRCPECDRAFRANPSQLRTNSTPCCSRSCGLRRRHRLKPRRRVPKIDGTCQRCGATIQFSRWRPRRFCSVSCAQLTNNSQYKHGLSGTIEYIRRCKSDWLKNHPEAASVGRHRRRARLRQAEGTFDRTDIERLVVRQKRRCALCRSSIAKGYHVDHIRPLVSGGSNWPSNLQLLCKHCNLSKWTRPNETFARSLGLLL